MTRAFIQEGALLAELSERSAAICQARDVGVLRMRDGREMPYMVLEWLEGRSFERIIEHRTFSDQPPMPLIEAVDLIGHLHPNVDLVSDIAPGLELREGDSARLRQVIVNLLDGFERWPLIPPACLNIVELGGQWR